MTPAARACAAEALGTALLLTAIVGSGAMGQRLSAGNDAIALLANSLATGCMLYVLVVVFAPSSGAHFNPLVTLCAAATRALSVRRAACYVVAQATGAVVGVVIAHAMFGRPWLQAGTTSRTGAGQWLAEAVATFGLVLVVRTVSRRGVQASAAAVGTYITAAYWFTASTSFANPAVTLARALTDSFAGIRAADVAPFVLAQAAGALAGFLAAQIADAPPPTA